MEAPHSAIMPYLIEARFGYVSLIIAGTKVDPYLINALLERWRSETHTFHLPSGEATITLQDVSFQLGLHIDGPVITGIAEDDWENLCLQYLGRIPDKLSGGKILLKWLVEEFSDLPDDASEETKQVTNIFIIFLINLIFYNFLY